MNTTLSQVQRANNLPNAFSSVGWVSRVELILFMHLTVIIRVAAVGRRGRGLAECSEIPSLELDQF